MHMPLYYVMYFSILFHFQASALSRRNNELEEELQNKEQEVRLVSKLFTG